MATDTARVTLELASGRNEFTAPFHQTAQRRRKQLEPDVASVGAPEGRPTPTQLVVDVPLATATQFDEAPIPDRTSPRNQSVASARPPWIAFILALIAVGGAVWWLMSQRMPDIDPRVVIERNLNDAQSAMADGRYTDPPERSAFHYYSTVLALDPNNLEAVAGIDAIADRHLTNARVLLADRKIAEAGVALDKARRVRPDHNGLAVLDAQWRTELRQILSASTRVAEPGTEAMPGKSPQKSTHNSPPNSPPNSSVAKLRDGVRPSMGGNAAQVQPPITAAPEISKMPPTQIADSVPGAGGEAIAQPPVADLSVITAALAANSPSPTSLSTSSALSAPDPEPSLGAVKTEANIIDENVASAAPTAAAVASIEPRLVRMVQPQYPQEALMRGLEGWVDVSLQVSPSGDVVAPRIEQSSRGRMFNRAALVAVQQWRYEPRSDTSERVRVRLQFKQSN